MDPQGPGRARGERGGAGEKATKVNEVVCYVAAVDRGISAGAMPGAEITLFTTAFQAIGYLFMMGVANVCYFAGPLSESLVKPTHLDRYRRVTYWLGFGFSVLLPFSIPALVFLNPSAVSGP